MSSDGMPFGTLRRVVDKMAAAVAMSQGLDPSLSRVEADPDLNLEMVEDVSQLLTAATPLQHTIKT